MSRTNCVYCGQEITTRSREHVIHNALGGLYESVDICCPGCNNYISRCIDAPFTKIFNPIIGQIQNFSKTNKTELPPCTGHAMYNGKIYNVGIKGTRIASCPELCRELRCDVSKIPMEIVSYDFNVDNAAFGTGIAKIAFNYALDKGIDLNLMKHGLDIKPAQNGDNSITFNYPIIPFYPMNPIDRYLELQTAPSLYHNMVLFNTENTLWCYVDLFNTFQYYVLLSENLPSGVHVHDVYTQTVQKINRNVPELQIFDPKDIMTYAMQYGVEPCMDLTEFKARIKAALVKKSQKIPLQNIVTEKMAGMPVFYLMTRAKSSAEMRYLHQSYMLYFNQSDEIKEDAFRTQTLSPDGREILSYPHAINDAIGRDKTALREYTNAKFNRLNSILCNGRIR